MQCDYVSYWASPLKANLKTHNGEKPNKFQVRTERLILVSPKTESQARMEPPQCKIGLTSLWDLARQGLLNLTKLEVNSARKIIVHQASKAWCNKD